MSDHLHEPEDQESGIRNQASAKNAENVAPPGGPAEPNPNVSRPPDASANPENVAPSTGQPDTTPERVPQPGDPDFCGPVMPTDPAVDGYYWRDPKKKNEIPREELDTLVLRLNPHLRESPGFLDDEQRLASSPLNVTTLEEFLKLTAGSPMESPEVQKQIADWEKQQAEKGNGETGKRGNGEAENVAPGAPGADASGSDKQPKKKRCTKKEKHRRLVEIQHLLIQQIPPRVIAEYAKEKWGLSKRSTQLYIQHIKKAHAKRASKEDYLGHLWLSKLQHDELYAIARKKLGECENEKQVPALLRQGLQALKQRDQVMERIKEHREASARDESPDSEKEAHRRRRLLVMPLAEWLERLHHLRNHWRWEWIQEMMQPEFDHWCRRNNLPIQEPYKTMEVPISVFQ